MTSKPVAVFYVPVVHAGYWKVLLDVSAQTDELWLVDAELYEQITGRKASIRSLRAVQAGLLISKFTHFRIIRDTVTPDELKSLNGRPVLTADEHLLREMATEYWPNSLVTYNSTFLRWDESNVSAADLNRFEPSSSNPADQELMRFAISLKRQSSDWWRQVGGALVRDRTVIASAYNRHLPDEYSPYLDGDPRDVIAAGQDSHIATSIHVEQQLITHCARHGIPIEGCDLYVTVYPCPMCAKQLAVSGIRRIFFESGHASLHGGEVLESTGIEVIRVQM